jgi:hypothetical protein
MVDIEYRRINEKLQDYWKSLRGDRPYPSETDINPKDIRDIWDYCFLIKLERDNFQSPYKYVYLGSQLVEAFGNDLATKNVNEHIMNPASRSLMYGFDNVIRTGMPVVEDSKFTNTRGVIIKYRSCILPLGDNKKGVTYLVGGMKWKIF